MIEEVLPECNGSYDHLEKLWIKTDILGMKPYFVKFDFFMINNSLLDAIMTFKLSMDELKHVGHKISIKKCLLIPLNQFFTILPQSL